MMRNLNTIAAGLALMLAGNSAMAMSELSSISVTPLWPTNSNPGNVLLYEIRLERTGAGLLEIELNSDSLPEGCSVSFSPAFVRLVGNDPKVTTLIMAVDSSQPTPADCCAFTVTAKSRRQSITFSNAPSTALRIGPVPSVLVSVIPREGGDIEVRGLGDTGQTYQIEATPDPVNPSWSPVGACTADGNGRFTFIHTGARNQGPPMRFYRAARVVPEN